MTSSKKIIRTPNVHKNYILRALDKRYLVFEATGELWVVAKELRTRGREPLPFSNNPFNLQVNLAVRLRLNGR